MPGPSDFKGLFGEDIKTRFQPETATVASGKNTLAVLMKCQYRCTNLVAISGSSPDLVLPIPRRLTVTLN